MSTEESKTDWRPSGVQNLIRYVSSGVYYARFKAGGKLIRHSLKTPVKSVARLRLADVLKDRRKSHDGRKTGAAGNMKFQDAVEIYRERLHANGALKPRSKEYREQIIICIKKTWPGIGEASRDTWGIQWHRARDLRT
jgi:hypothetical protein